MSKGLNTKEKIIRKSSELFNTYGYHGCSLNDIMKATNLKKGGIYNHFSNKDEIALEAFDYNFKRLQKKFTDRLSLARTPSEKLNSIIDVYASLANDPAMKGGCPIFNTAVDASDSHPLLKKKAKNAIKTLKTYIKIKIEEGIASGEFKAGVNKDEIATLIIITLEGCIIMSRVFNDNSVQGTIKFLKRCLKEKLYNMP